MSTINEILQLRAHEQPNDVAYAFLQDGKILQSVTYLELERRAAAVAVRLRDLNAAGPVLLLHPSGLDFIAAFFGCLHAGLVAVPLFPPRRNRSDPRLAAVIADAKARFALMTSEVLEDIKLRAAQLPEFDSLTCVATDGLMGDATASPPCASEMKAPAYLQYTSGSTSTPKGVEVSHAGLIHTLTDLDRSLEHKAGSVMVTWLPLFHDLGLIYGVLQPLYNGFPCYLMEPAAFSQRPVRWLEALSNYRGTHSPAPNFAYELCTRTVSEAEKAKLDLSHWHVAFNAAEPVREETLRTFTAAFASCGFTAKAFCPAYGLAEATLKVTGVRREIEPRVLRVDAVSLSRDRVEEADPAASDTRTLVGCGVSEIGTRIAIVDPDTFIECPTNRVGEIWVKGGIVAQGYWQRARETEETFATHLADTGEGPFLRTGDLGFLNDGELFITGRLKDIVIVRGMNHYPQDIELTVERCHPALRPGCGAAFAVEREGEERLIVAQEVERTKLRNLDTDEIVRAIRAAVAREHDLTVHAVTLLRPASIPKTSSGKIQRRHCRAAFEAGGLKAVAQWQQPLPPAAERSATTPAAKPSSAGSVEQWILGRLAERLNINPSQVDPREPFVMLGLDSLSAVRTLGGTREVAGPQAAAHACVRAPYAGSSGPLPDVGPIQSNAHRCPRQHSETKRAHRGDRHGVSLSGGAQCAIVLAQPEFGAGQRKHGAARHPCGWPRPSVRHAACALPRRDR